MESKQYLALYEAMAAEGERLAQERHAILGDYQPDASFYITLKDTRPAYTAWKNAQAESVTIINRLEAALIKAREALEYINQADLNGLHSVKSTARNAIATINSVLGE